MSPPFASLADAADEPTPEPRSAIWPAGSAEDLFNELPEELRNDPFVRYMMDPPAEDLVNLDAHLEAAELYGDDAARELADIEAGRHPLQRARSAAP